MSPDNWFALTIKMLYEAGLKESGIAPEDSSAIIRSNADPTDRP